MHLGPLIKFDTPAVFTVVRHNKMSTNTSFFDNARNYRSNYKDEKAWARHFARVYFHEVDTNP